ncbi:MAG TPA: hypothetical protein DER01_09085 [Phycisphaerales bacterium]|nr:hypothetical protein [Phycisphaerales bacterium]
MPRIPLTFEQVRQRAIDAIADCQDMVTDTDSRDDPQIIHDLRITGKRLRAWGRLMRQTWGDATWRSVDGWIRQMCHLLAGARDQLVCQQTLNQLTEISQARSKTKTLSSLGRLQQHWTSLQSNTPPQNQPVDWPQVTKQLSLIYEHWHNHPCQDLCPKQQQRHLSARLQNTYTKARRLGRQVHNDAPNTDPLLCHRFRKWLKHLLYQLELLSTFNPHINKLNKLQSKLKTITDALGDHHDLSQLADQIHERTNELDDKAVKRVTKLMRQEQTDLLTHAMKKFRQVFEEKSEKWVKGICGSCKPR